MELTPQTLHAVEFREARRGGYNTRDVDDFLERVATGVGHLHERLRELGGRAESAEGRLVEAQRQLDELSRRPPAQASVPMPAPGVAPGPSPHETDETLRRTLVLAQRTADATIKEAKQEANRLLDEAREEAARTRAAAEHEARRGADSARLTVEAELEGLVKQREALKTDVDALAQHLDDQREHLRAGVDELRRLLDAPALTPLPLPPLADVSRLAAPGAAGDGRGFGTSPLSAAPSPAGSVPDPSNGQAPDAPTPFAPGSPIAALTEPPPAPGRGAEAGPAPQPMPFSTPNDTRGPWLPSELRTSTADEPPEREPLPSRRTTPPPAPPFGSGVDAAGNGTPSGPDTDGRPSEWGRAVFDPEVPEADRLPRRHDS
jgi:DivIVA domain-containing protein